jgi:L-galactonate dehydratase
MFLISLGIAYDRRRRFIEEPTAPDDVLGHAAIRKALRPYNIGVATGEHCANRILFKQLLQAGLPLS